MPWHDTFQVLEKKLVFVSSCAVVYLYEQPIRKWPATFLAINEATYCSNNAAGSGMDLFCEREEGMSVLGGVTIKITNHKDSQCTVFKIFCDASKVW